MISPALPICRLSRRVPKHSSEHLRRHSGIDSATSYFDFLSVRRLHFVVLPSAAGLHVGTLDR